MLLINTGTRFTSLIWLPLHVWGADDALPLLVLGLCCPSDLMLFILNASSGWLKRKKDDWPKHSIQPAHKLNQTSYFENGCAAQYFLYSFLFFSLCCIWKIFYSSNQFTVNLRSWLCNRHGTTGQEECGVQVAITSGCIVKWVWFLDIIIS